MRFVEDWVGDGTWADILTIGLFALAAVAAYVAVRLVLPVVRRFARRSKFRWDDIILDRKLRHRIALLAPAVLFYVGARGIADDSSSWRELLVRTSAAVLIAIGAMTVAAILHSANTVYEAKAISKDRPIEPYIQLGVILVYLFAAVFVIATLADQPPWFFVSGLGAMTAVLLLIFKDTILSFIASIQLAQNDMVDVGDWIEMPEFNADGDVIDVALHTVTVQNFDKTITTIPTYKLINQSFRNWRGMRDADRRRIKRSLHVDLSSIRFLSIGEIERFSNFEPLRDYMATKLAELADDRVINDPEPGYTGDPRRLTNIGTLRAYIVSYLDQLDTVDTDNMTFLVRQLQPGPHGLPLEIYVFATTTDWAEYEAVQADIFDHILAMVPKFGLRLFQEPTGGDVRLQAPRSDGVEAPNQSEWSSI